MSPVFLTFLNFAQKARENSKRSKTWLLLKIIDFFGHLSFFLFTGSSVCSNTPSLVGENLESFSLGETEKKPDKNAFAINTTPLVQISAPPLKRSLFSNVPPTITFVHHNEVSEVSLPAELRKLLRWKLSNITPAVVKKVVTNSGFRLMRKTCSEWGGTWGKHMKAELFKELHECQKINHLPGKIVKIILRMSLIFLNFPALFASKEIKTNAAADSALI